MSLLRWLVERMAAAVAVVVVSLVALPAAATPPYRYYVLTPEHLAADLSVTSLEPGNTINAGSLQRSLSAYESAVIPASALSPGTVITGSARYTVGSNANAADLLAPDFLAGTEFVIPHITGSHRYYIQATSVTTNLTIRLGAATSTLQAIPGTAYEIDAGSDNAIAGRITSDHPIVVAHVAYVSNVPQDAYTVPPTSTEALGIRSQAAVIGASADGTSVTVYTSDGSTNLYALDAGQKVAVNVGGNAAQGMGAAIRVVANHPIAAVQYDDGDGADASAFWPTTAFSLRYAFPVNAQYVAVACLTPNVTVTLFRSSASPETQVCSANGADPGKVYFGANSSGANIPAGWYLHANAPLYVMYEAADPQDEHNLAGAQSVSGPSAPTLSAITTPTTSNPVAITGAANANAVIRLYVNGRLQQTTTASGAGSFSFNTALFDGNNVISAVTLNGEDESAPSNALEVTYNNVLPRTQSGTISTNVVWTPGNPATPYVISSAFTVAVGANLTLQPGTTLRFANGASLTVNGALKIAGTSQSPVILTSNAASPSRGNWGGIVLNAAGAEIINAQIDWASTGIKVNGVAVAIRNSTIRNFPAISGAGIWVLGSGASGTQISGNAIRGVSREGRCILVEDSSPTIANNTLSICDRGVSVYRSSSPNIIGNTITGNDNGIYVDGAATASPQPIVSGNEISGNNERNYVAANFVSGAQNLKLNATANWWGTVDLRAISTSITDWSDEPSSTKAPSVDFGTPLNGVGGTPIAGNYILGPLTTSTTLAAGTTYQAIGALQIVAGTSLTIQAGARLNFHAPAAPLLVDGSLTVQGMDGSLAQITSGRASPGRTDWAGIQVRAGGSAFIEYSVIEWASIPIKTTGVPITVRFSTIRNFTSVSGAGVWVSGNDASGTQIVGNTIRGVSDEGRCIYAEDSSPTITNNMLSECDIGVSVYRSSSPTITGNIITGNDNGIYVNGADINPQPIVTGNQIYSNGHEGSDYNYVATNFAVGALNLKLNATGNWWGTADVRVISATIWDWSDSPASVDLPSVDFSGFLNAVGGTPAVGNYIFGPLAAASTTLTAGTTYEAIGVVQIPAGKSLTVQAGARLNFYSGSAALLVDGTLAVQGVEGNPVQITSGRSSPTRTDWGGIQVRAGGSAVIEYALIEWAFTAIKTTGAPIAVRYSTIRNFAADAGTGVWVSGNGASGTQIIGNMIRGVSDQGRCIFAEDSSPTITNNSLTDCDVGISVYRTSSPNITGNTITSNDNGIYVNGGVASPQPIATGNSIFSNDGWNYWATNFAAGAQNFRLNATGNWWGATNPAVIGESISDLNDAYTSTTLPTVDYSGFLDGPAGATVTGNQLVGPLAAASTVLSAGATYDVLGMTIVPSSKALTIPGGTILRFYNSAALLVEGTLQIQGSQSARVRLTSAQSAPAPGNWQGVVVRGAAAAADIDNADIEWTVRGVEVQSATVNIRNSLLHHFSTAGIAMTGSNASSQILDNVIDNYTKVGDGIALANSSPAVTGNRITRTNRALYMNGTSKPAVSANVLTDNNWGIYLFGNSSNSAAEVPLPVVQGNDIYGNTTAQLEVNGYAAANPAQIDARGNWWGTPMPSAGGEIRFSAGSVVSSLDFSNEVSASINFDSQAPSVPRNLSAMPVSASSIQLSWSASTDDFGVIEYLIERCAGMSCNDFTQIATSSVTGYSDGGLVSSYYYRYRVRVRDVANLLSGYSEIAGTVAALDTQAPTAPTALAFITASSTQIDLRWSGSTDNSGVVVYVIERCLGAGCTSFAEIASVTTSSFRNTGLTAASSYNYRVRARDAALNFSAYTTIDTAVTSITGADCD